MHYLQKEVTLLSMLALAVQGALPTICLAQDTSLRLEEIVVTARKRSESVQEIPESITAFSEAAVEKAGITRVADVVSLIPNMVLQPSFRLGVVNLSARGIATPQQGDSPVVLNFNGVQAPAQDFINQDLFDIERIEVLKGPQGALYGAGAIAGAINIYTKAPSNELEGFVKAEFGNNAKRRYVGALSGPIVEDKLLFRIAASHSERDGYIENTLTGDLVDFFDEDSLRGSLLVDLERVRIDFSAAYTETHAGASYYESFPLIPDPVPEIDELFGGPLGRFGSDISDADFENHSNVQTEEERELMVGSLKVEFDVANGVFSSITGYNDSEQFDYGDLDFQPSDVLLQDVRFDVEVLNQEFRFASDDSERFRWVGGVFYQERDIYNQVIVLLGDFTTGHKGLEESRNNPANSVFTDGRDENESEAWGIFFSSNYDITDDMVLTAAIRYDEVDVATRYVGEDPNFVNLPGQTASDSFDEWQPKLNLAYNFTSEAMGYIDIARGFRAGVPNPTAAYATGLDRFIQPEVADTIEIGIKSTWLDNRLSLNGAIFYTEIENRHHYFFGASLQSMTTYDEAEVTGLEVDLVAVLTEDLRLSASVGFLSPEITSDEITNYLNSETGEIAVTVNNRGNVLPDTPETTANISLDYDKTLSSGLSLFGRVNYKYIDKIYFDTENLIDDGGSKSYVDLRAGMEGSSVGWKITGYVKNATDERTHTNYAYSGGQGNYLPNEPRTYGVELDYRF